MVAEKILAAEQAPETMRDAAMAECVGVILKLCAHRYTLPPCMRPLRELDPLLRTLKSFGVDERDELRFFASRPNSEELEGATDEERQIFEFAVGIDHAARELIRNAFGAAAERSLGLVHPWLEEAVNGNLDATVKLRIAKFAVDGLVKR